jgi:hypothetical protein
MPIALLVIGLSDRRRLACWRRPRLSVSGVQALNPRVFVSDDRRGGRSSGRAGSTLVLRLANVPLVRQMFSLIISIRSWVCPPSTARAE